MEGKMCVGILTYYYHTHNYGGMLQAYALTKFLLEKGILAEQICCIRDDERPFESLEEQNQQKQPWLSRIAASIEYRTFRSWYQKRIVPLFEKRNEKFRVFEKQIPHSKKVYSLNTIDSANECYSHFITGSDQIWTFRWFNPIFFLEFVRKGKRKISYAASIGKSRFTPKEKSYLAKTLPEFDAVSVREEDLVDELHNISGCDIDLVLDPTLLLSREEWDSVASKNIVEGEYIFCYFLGNDPLLRKVAKQFAKRKQIKLVTIPFANQAYNKPDFFFGDEKIYDAGPEEFLALIRGARYVLTDSFHASVFSIVFQRNFVTFSREGAVSMNSRLYSLMELFHCNERFLVKRDAMTTENLLRITKDKVRVEEKHGNDLRDRSKKYLMRNLE